MADDLKNSCGSDRRKINVNQDHEVQYWTKALGVTPEQLKAAVKAVGVEVEDVRKHLKK